MSPDERVQMQNTNKVVQGAGVQTFISTNGISDFKEAAPRGSVYVEFDFPANSLLQGGNFAEITLVEDNSCSLTQSKPDSMVSVRQCLNGNWRRSMIQSGQWGMLPSLICPM
jgi:hypothetical protein